MDADRFLESARVEFIHKCRDVRNNDRRRRVYFNLGWSIGQMVPRSGWLILIVTRSAIEQPDIDTRVSRGQKERSAPS